MSEDPRDQIIDAAYRRASEAEAGGPSVGTRAAILAEAEAASRRRARAATDSRYRWGALAAVAVIGLGVLIWRQTADAPPSARATAQPAAPAPPAQMRQSAPGAASLNAEEAARLLREHFPDQYQSTSSHRLWLVRSHDGQVLQSGELQASQDWNHVEEQLRGLQGHTPGPWQRQQLRNGAGQLIEISVSEVNMGEPQR